MNSSLLRTYLDTLFFFFSLSLSIGTAPLLSRYSGGNYLEEDKYSPGFLTLGQKYSIALGSTVVLPCKINETGKRNGSFSPRSTCQSPTLAALRGTRFSWLYWLE